MLESNLNELRFKGQHNLESAIATRRMASLASSSQQNMDAYVVTGALPLLIAILGPEQPFMRSVAPRLLKKFCTCFSVTMAASAAPTYTCCLVEVRPACCIRGSSMRRQKVCRGSQQSKDAILAAADMPCLLPCCAKAVNMCFVLRQHAMLAALQRQSC